MNEPKYLISPKVAIGTAVVAGISLVAAIVAREKGVGPLFPDTAPDVAVKGVGPLFPDAAEKGVGPLFPDTAPDAGVPAVVDPPIASVPPKIEGVKARAQVATLGVDVQLDVAIAFAAAPNPKDSVGIKASCKLDGEWFSGATYLRMSKLAAGTSVVQHKIAIGRQHAFTQPPTECQLGFEYTTQQPYKREWIAKMCWDGNTVSDKPCAMKPNTSVAVSAVRVAATLDRYRTRAPLDFEVALDAKLARPLADWAIEVAANCTLPDGTTHKAAERVFTHDVHAGRPFTGKTRLFRGAQQMIEVPQSCTVAVELADRERLVREPVATYCWRAGATTSGAC